MPEDYIDFFEYNNLQDKPSLYLALGFTLALFLSIPVLVWGILTGNFEIRTGAEVVSEISRQVEEVTTAVPGDLTGDGKVDLFDYNILVENFGRDR